MLRFTDLGGHRFTCFAADSKGGQLADLKLRHRLRARGKDASAPPKTLVCATCSGTATPRTRSGPNWLP
jgi:hypothetical protein